MVLERIKQFIDYKEIAISAFEKSIGMSNASLGKSLKTGGTIGADKIGNILNVYPEINLRWLITGEGEMLNGPSLPEFATEHKPTFSSAEILLREMLAEERSRTDALQERINELIEENARLKTLIESERKGGVA
jgi:hypothetical protein